MARFVAVERTYVDAVMRVVEVGEEFEYRGIWSDNIKPLNAKLALQEATDDLRKECIAKGMKGVAEATVEQLQQHIRDTALRNVF